MDIEVLESGTKTIGSLGLVYGYMRRLGVAETIDGLTTQGKWREVSTGQVMEVLVLNRLSLRPSPISRIGDWAKTQAIEEVYGVAAEALNDDRIGRALEEAHPHLRDAWAAIVLKGAQEYKVSLGQLHSDVTRLAFEGAYEGSPGVSEEGRSLARITYGYTGHQDPSRKQLTLSLSVAADGGIPAWYRVADGNAADTRAYLGHLTAVREHLGLDKPLVVGDSKLITRPNLLGFCRVGARFLGPASLSEANRRELVELWQEGAPWQRLDPPAPGDPPKAGRYWGLERPFLLEDPEGPATFRLRRVFVQSLDDRKAVRRQRAKDLARAHRDLWTVQRRLGLPAYRDRALVERKVAQAAAKVRRYLSTEVTETPQGLQLRWRLDWERLREDCQFDGLYCLLTNMPEASTCQVFRAYKDQAKVEGRFRAVKQPPVQIRPVWLHNPRRIESLVFVVMVALFLFALIEREARRVVQESGQRFTGLHPEGRDKLPVTAERLFQAFAPLTLVKQRLRVGTECVEVLTPASLTPVQAQVLHRLGLMQPHAYLHPTITSTPFYGCGK